MDVKSFFQRWISGTPDPGERTRTSSPELAPGALADTTAGAATGSASPGTQPAWTGTGARRPVIADTGAVIGYEFCLPPLVMKRLEKATEQAVKSAYIATVLASASLSAKSGKMGFARIPAHLVGPDMVVQDCAGVWVALECAPDAARDKLQPQHLAAFVHRVRQARAKVGWNAPTGSSGMDVAPDFVLLLQGQSSISGLVGEFAARPQAFKGLPALATDLGSEEDLEAALLGGISYVCGAFQRNATPAPGALRQRVPPDVIRLVNLMHLLQTDAELAALVNDIKGDVGLSYRLLSVMKGATYANHSAGLNIEQTVLTLGRNELHRILSIMLLRYTGARKVSSALEVIALWRARLLELLATERDEASPGHFFTLGLVSMLGSILKQDLSDVVEKLSLADPAKQALLSLEGPWSPYLRVAMEVEGQTLDSSGLHLADFGGADRISALSDTAWDWAEQQSRRK